MAHFIPSAGVPTKGSYNSTAFALTAKLRVQGAGASFPKFGSRVIGEKLAAKTQLIEKRLVVWERD